MLGDRALLRPGRVRQFAAQRRERNLDLDGGRSDRLDLAGRQPAILARRGLANQLADAPRVLRRDRLGQLHEDATAESANVVERRKNAFLGPVRQPAGPEVVVLVEVLLLAGGEVVPPA